MELKKNYFWAVEELVLLGEAIWGMSGDLKG
jgi:hypothetical protein